MGDVLKKCSYLINSGGDKWITDRKREVRIKKSGRKKRIMH